MTEPRQRTERLTDRDKPMLTNTFYTDDNVVQFLVTIRKPFTVRDIGKLRRAIVATAEVADLDIAVAGSYPMPFDHPFNHKRG